MGKNKDKNKENEEVELNAPIENVGAEEISSEEKKSKSVTSEKPQVETDEKTAVLIDEVRYNQLNRVAVGYGMKKHELDEFFKKEVSSEIEIINHKQNNRQVKYKFKNNIFPKEGYYSCK